MTAYFSFLMGDMNLGSDSPTPSHVSSHKRPRMRLSEALRGTQTSQGRRFGLHILCRVPAIVIFVCPRYEPNTYLYVVSLV